MTIKAIIKTETVLLILTNRNFNVQKIYFVLSNYVIFLFISLLFKHLITNKLKKKTSLF